MEMSNTSGGKCKHLGWKFQRCRRGCIRHISYLQNHYLRCHLPDGFQLFVNHPVLALFDGFVRPGRDKRKRYVPPVNVGVDFNLNFFGRESFEEWNVQLERFGKVRIDHLRIVIHLASVLFLAAFDVLVYLPLPCCVRCLGLPSP